MQEAWVQEIHEQCRQAQVSFFFKQWGGVRKKRNGRLLGGRTWDDMPTVAFVRDGVNAGRRPPQAEAMGL